MVIELSAGVMNLKVGNGRATAMSDFPADNTALRFEIVTLLYVPPSVSVGLRCANLAFERRAST